MDFQQLKDLPAWVIIAGIAIYFIKDNKEDKKYYRNESKEDKKSFLEAIRNIAHKQEKTDGKVDKLTGEVERVLKKIDRRD